MLVNDPKNRSWLFGLILVTVAALVWYGAESRLNGGRVPGSNASRLTFGIAGGLICMCEMFLWPRKAFRRWAQTFRLGNAQNWMRAHLWLGFLSLPLLILHAGIYPWGGSLSTILMALFLMVIVSGVWGLAMQQIIPRKMLQELPGETIYSQIDFVSAQLRNEARRIVLSTCGTPQFAPIDSRTEAMVVAGKPRTTTSTVVFEPVPHCELLQHQWETKIALYLCPDSLYHYYQKNPRNRPKNPPTSKASKSPLRDIQTAATFFQNLKLQVDPQAHSAVDALAELCDQRRQFAHQKRLHHLLHNWLAVHLPLSIALIVLMWVHIFVSLRYI